MAGFGIIAASMWEALKAILASPFKEWSLWWLLAPIFILWILMELYFGKFKKEKLGWNTSLANGISLSWIGVESMRFLFSTKPDPFWFRFIIISLIILYGIIVFFLAFSHKISGNITYLLASPTPVYYLSTITILWGHGSLIMTWWVLLDLLILYWVLLGLFILIKKFIPESQKEIEESQSADIKDSSLDSGSSDSSFEDFKL